MKKKNKLFNIMGIKAYSTHISQRLTQLAGIWDALRYGFPQEEYYKNIIAIFKVH